MHKGGVKNGSPFFVAGVEEQTKVSRRTLPVVQRKLPRIKTASASFSWKRSLYYLYSFSFIAR
jgi:hypothetical protein